MEDSMNGLTFSTKNISDIQYHFGDSASSLREMTSWVGKTASLQSHLQNADGKDLRQSLPLPVELLVEIFSWCICLSKAASLSARPDQTLKSISHVCETWRTITLGNGSLWSESIDFMNETPRWLQERLKRSGVCPLIVHLNFRAFRYEEGSHYNRSAILQRANKNVLYSLEHLHRLEELHILEAPRFILKEILRKLTGTAVNLKSLTLSLYVGQMRNPLSIPVALSQLYTPKLRHARLVHCGSIWNIPAIRTPSLTQLRLFGITEKCPSNLLPEILKVLPMLSILEIDGDIPQCEVPSELVQLRNLCTLHLSGKVSRCERLLSCLIFPRSTVLDLECDASHHSMEQLLAFKKLLASKCDTEKVESLIISSSGSGRDMCISARTNSMHDYSPILRCKSYLRMNIDLTWGASSGGCNNVIFQIIGWFCIGVSYPHLNAVHIDFPRTTDFCKNAWVSILESFNSVQCLQIMGGQCNNMLSALSEHKGEMTEESQTPPVMPSLKIINIILVNLKSSTIFKSLVLALRRRRAHGGTNWSRGIQKIRLNSCFLDQRIIELLRREVEDTLWKGCTVVGGTDKDTI